MPFGLLVSGALALANLKGMAWGINAFLGLGSARASKRLLLLSYVRFLVLLVIFGALMKFRLVNPMGVIFGLTIVFTAVLMEGIRVTRTWRKSDKIEPGDFSDEDPEEESDSKDNLIF